MHFFALERGNLALKGQVFQIRILGRVRSSAQFAIPGLKAWVFILFILILTPLWGESSLNFGKVEMETSGSRQASQHFFQGLAAMHLFEYKEARKEFQEARRLDPNFALAYWGEAMTHTELFWKKQNHEEAQKVIELLGKTSAERIAKAKLPIEKDLVRSLDYLYGPGSKQKRIENFCSYMEELYQKYPTHNEIVSFYSLSLLGTINPSESSETKKMKSVGIILHALGWNPSKELLKHPGLLHYLIHSVDDRVHAWLGLNAANVIADAAPDSPHAVHMPAHIYVPLGMWEKAVEINTIAYEVSLRRGEPDLHVLYWLLYTHLQTGRYEMAKKDVEQMIHIAAQDTDCSSGGPLLGMVARYSVETKDFSLLPLDLKRISECHLSSTPEYYSYLYALGAQGLQKKDFKETDHAIERLIAARDSLVANHSFSDDEKGFYSDYITIQIATLNAQQSQIEGYPNEALKQLKHAAQIEQRFPLPEGIPMLVQSPLELYGHTLLQQNQWKEAAEVYKLALERTPNRVLCYLCLARAAIGLNDQTLAKKAYKYVLETWPYADKNLKGLKEARDYLSKK